jgi:hypothetical protein
LPRKYEIGVIENNGSERSKKGSGCNFKNIGKGGMAHNSRIGFKRIKENNVDRDKKEPSCGCWPNGMKLQRSAVKNEKHC